MTRWWAPTDAHVGPDDTDLALLEPGGEARYDLGAALLALHRTGAAACEAVATSPIPDEHALLTALATARAAVAVPAVETIAKCVDGGSYAGLLVRDFFDDAEECALDLFRAAVSKGVPPPIAVERVGMVFGVPKDGLGAYRQVALETRAHPAALTDAADRALWTHIELVCSEEIDDRVEVAKVTATPDDPDTPYWDARRGDGRFAPRGDNRPVAERERVPVDFDLDALLRQGAERLAEPEVEAPPAPPVEERERRERRERRTRREPRHAQATGSAQPTGRTARPIARRPAGREKAKYVPGRPTATRLKAVRPLSREEARTIDQLGVGRPTQLIRQADFTAKLPDEPGLYQPSTAAMSFVLDQGQYGAFISHTGRDEFGRRQFRAGYLAELLGEPMQYASVVHESKVQFSALNPHDTAAPMTKVITDSEVREHEDRDHLLFGLKKDLVDEWLANQDVAPADYAEQLKEYTKLVKEARTPDDTATVLIFSPPGTHEAAVNEFIFDAGVMNVRFEGSERHGNYQVNPNQMFRVSTSEPDRAYDPLKKVWRLRWYVDPAGDLDVGKAEDWDPQEHPRAPSGRVGGGRFVATGERVALPDDVREQLRTFVPDEEAAVEQAPAEERRERRERRPRRTVAQPLRPTARPQAPRAAGRPAARAAAARPIQRELAKRPLDRKEIKVIQQAAPKLHSALRDDGQHLVLTEAHFYSLLNSMRHDGQADLDAVTLYGPALEALVKMRKNAVGGHAAMAEVALATSEQISDGEIGESYRVLSEYEGIELPVDDDDAEALMRRVLLSVFRSTRHENIAQILVVGGAEPGTVDLMVNRHPVEPYVILEFEDGYKDAEPSEMVKIGTFRGPHISIEPVTDPDNPYSSWEPNVTGMKLTGPMVTRWRVQNVPQ